MTLLKLGCCVLFVIFAIALIVVGLTAANGWKQVDVLGEVRRGLSKVYPRLADTTNTTSFTDL